METEHTGLATDAVAVAVFFEEKKVAEGTGSSVRLAIPKAQLWSAEHPALYRCEVTLKRNGVVLDTHSTRFGIRKIGWSATGLTVNGETVKLRGGCIHHDNGILGARSFAESEWRRVKKLKEWGFNAIRSAHDPACPALLDACDALGMYVMDEAWDMWDKPKSAHDYAARFPENYQGDVQSMVGKDYNHPSVILYSIGNEVTEPAKPKGVALAEQIVRAFKALDTTRPTTIGLNLMLVLLASMGQTFNGGGAGGQEKVDSTAYNKMVSEMGARMVQAAAREDADQVTAPVLALLDIAGYNYAQSRYEMDGALHPERVIVGSETFPQDLPSNWALVEKLPYLIGDFMWTAWDYLGEVGLGAWSYDYEDAGFDKNYPWLLADSGALDILGNDTAEAGMAAAVWGCAKAPYIGVRPADHPGVEPIGAIWRGTNAIPSWSWQGCKGNEATVEVWSAGAEAELFLNGVSAGRAPIQAFKATFHVPYAPGELRAVVYDASGTALGESTLHTATGGIAIRVEKEPAAVPGSDIVYLDISLVGENGAVESNADAKLAVSVQGGELLAFGSARPKTAESFLSGEYTTYYGRAQAVVRANGAFRVQVSPASGNGLETVCCTVPANTEGNKGTAL